jgi:hypothetical protein
MVLPGLRTPALHLLLDAPDRLLGDQAQHGGCALTRHEVEQRRLPAAIARIAFSTVLADRQGNVLTEGQANPEQVFLRPAFVFRTLRQTCDAAVLGVVASLDFSEILIFGTLANTFDCNWVRGGVTCGLAAFSGKLVRALAGLLARRPCPNGMGSALCLYLLSDFNPGGLHTLPGSFFIAGDFSAL